MKYRCLPIVVTLACRMAVGDTLILKDGQKIEGRYLSSSDSAVQFEVNGKPFTYSVWLMRELRFHSGAGSSASPAPAYNGLRGKEQQDQFCTVLKNYIQARNKVAAEPNPIRRAEMHPPDPWSFEDSIARVFGPNGEFSDWDRAPVLFRDGVECGTHVSTHVRSWFLDLVHERVSGRPASQCASSTHSAFVSFGANIA